MYLPRPTRQKRISVFLIISTWCSEILINPLFIDAQILLYEKRSEALYLFSLFYFRGRLALFCYSIFRSPVVNQSSQISVEFRASRDRRQSNISSGFDHRTYCITLAERQWVGIVSGPDLLPYNSSRIVYKLDKWLAQPFYFQIKWYKIGLMLELFSFYTVDAL